MSPLIGVLLVAGIVLPHVLSLKRAAPGAAATIWASALALRALAVLAGVLYVALLVPRTELFAALTHWCWHAVPALLATQAGVDGHLVGDVATVAPVALLAVSGLWATVALMRAARGMRNVIAQAAVAACVCRSATGARTAPASAEGSSDAPTARIHKRGRRRSPSSRVGSLPRVSARTLYRPQTTAMDDTRSSGAAPSSCPLSGGASVSAQYVHGLPSPTT